MLRQVLVSAALVMAPISISMSAPAAAAEKSSGKCDSAAKKKKKSMFGSMLGGVAAGMVGGGLGGVGSVIAFPATELLSAAIIEMLDCKEQQQAAKATDDAVRGGVGTTSTWESETRPGVRGSSTVTASNAAADGSQCMTVTDVVIVDGEETTVPKRMCRKPGESRYAVV
jgi:predicted lipid-binding transport protein (Tim44 family)